MRTLKILIVVLLIANLPSKSFAQSQRVFDTELTTTAEQNSGLRQALDTKDLFDRTVRPFEVGWNFSSVKNLSGNQFLGVSIFDDNFYAGSAETWYAAANKEKLSRIPDHSRMILVNKAADGDHILFWGVGYAIMTRIDPEITVSDGVPEIETGGNTGAVHGFVNSFGTKKVGYTELRTTSTGTYSGGSFPGIIVPRHGCT